MTADVHAVPTWGDRLRMFLACQAVATAVWLIPASVQIVRWPAEGPVRLGLVPPLWQLAFASGIALLLSVLLLRRTNTSLTSPFMLLWLWVLPYLPWLPDRLPLLLVLAGPLRWVVAAAAVAMLLGRRSQLHAAALGLDRISRPTIFAVSLIVYLGAGLYAVSSTGLGGDEPHYLIISESLLNDGDLKIENNHQQRDYRAFSAATLRPDFYERGKNGEIYSVHAPGLAVLVLPVYALAGHWGAVALMCVLSALSALAIFDLASLVTSRRRAAITWIVTCFTVPFIPEAWSLFPETPAALLIAWGALWLVQPAERSPAIWFWRGLALSTLPWFHTKFSICLAILGLALAWRLRRRLPAAAALLLPIGFSTAAWLYSFFVIYGSFDPQAPYGNYTSEFVLTRNIPHGLIGLFTDQKFGLLVYSPIYLLAIGGFLAIWRRREWRFAGASLLVLLAAFTLSTARLYMFWGGTSAPARFLVPMVPCLAFFLATALNARREGRAYEAAAGLWLCLGLGIACWSMLWPAGRILFSDPHGHARVLELIQGSAPLAASVQTFTEPDWQPQIASLGVWMLAALGGLAAATVWSRNEQRSAWSIATAACIAFLAVGATTAHLPDAADREETARRGANGAIWQFDAARQTAIDYQTMSVATVDRVRELSTMTILPEHARVQAGGPVAGPVMLPAGHYEARVWFRDARPRTGSIRATAIPPAPFGEMTGPLSNPATVVFDLPVTIWRWMLAIDRENAVDVERVEIVPAGVRPPREREGDLVRSVEPLGDDARYLIYTDEHAFPEKGVFWTERTSRARVLVAPATATRLVLTLYTGPENGSVDIAVADEHRTVASVAGQEQDVVFTLPPGERLVPLSVRSTTTFRPADVNPSSTDVRSLGVQVRLRLE